MRRKFYNSVRDEAFAVTLNGKVLCDSFGVPMTFNTEFKAASEAMRRNTLFGNGHAVTNFAVSHEARPFKLHVSGTGF